MLIDALRTIADFPLFTAAGAVITPRKIGLAVGLFLAVFVLLRVVERWLTRRFVARRDSNNGSAGVIHAVATILRYIVFGASFLVVLDTMGIDLSAVVVVFGTLGIGIGLAIQPLLTNFISGIVLLLERSIKIGDRIEVGDLVGDVARISMRSTTVVTNDSIAVIVPNGLLATSQIINWTHTGHQVRFRIPVGVSYRSEPEAVAEVLIEVAMNHPGVLRDPAPDVLFDGFGDSALNFILRISTQDYAHRPGVIRSELNFAIHRAFREHEIEIPFPQRDIHIKST